MNDPNSSAYFRALLGLRTLTPLHAGVLGGNHIVDRPIDRDIHNKWPKISSTALKGALREDIAVVKNSIKNRDLIFGLEDSSPDGDSERRLGKSGLLSFTDARLLLFPVHSVRGVWAWVTCPRALRKLRDEATLAGFVKTSNNDAVFQALDNAIGDQAVYAGNMLAVNAEKLQLYQHTFRIDRRLTPEQMMNWKDSFPLLDKLDDFVERVVIVSDENFGIMTHLYIEHSTRNKINDDTSSTVGGTLFTEEHLPANTLLYALAFSMPDKNHQEIASLLDMHPKRMQIGGNATLGRGRCFVSWHTK